MIFAGIQRTSTIDFPGRLSSILFTSGCMFRCHYCHNPELVLEDIDPKFSLPNPKLTENEVMDLLDARKNLVDSVSITGGEVTIHKDLLAFVKKLKAKGYNVKIDTNGVNPEALKSLLPYLDFIAMDVKGVDELHYRETVGVPVNFENIRRSIELIMNSNVDYEFRTTVVPELFPVEKFELLGKLLEGSRKHVIQQFVNKKTLNPDFEDKSPYTPQELREIKEILEQYIDIVEIRGI